MVNALSGKESAEGQIVPKEAKPGVVGLQDQAEQLLQLADDGERETIGEVFCLLL